MRPQMRREAMVRDKRFAGMHRFCRGFTVVELGVVAGILAVLAALLVPMCHRSRAHSKRIICASNLNGLGRLHMLCLVETSNSFPDAYYNFSGDAGTYQVALRAPGADRADALFAKNVTSLLMCPMDSTPVDVLAGGRTATAKASYAYNVLLPLSYDSAARLLEPANTVTFYDGDAAGVVGVWEYSSRWAEPTVRRRHAGRANYLFLDGHVENQGAFPDRGFRKGDWWVAYRDGPVAAPAEPDPIDITVSNGNVVLNEDCIVTITCLGAEFQNGAHGARIPVHAFYRVNSASWNRFAGDVQGGEQVVLNDLTEGDTVGIRSRWRLNARDNGDYTSNDGSGHVWILRQGDVVPSIEALGDQASIASFLDGYIDGNGRLTIGVNEVVFLFELSKQTDYKKFSSADFQDLVVLVSMTRPDEGK